MKHYRIACIASAICLLMAIAGCTVAEPEDQAVLPPALASQTSSATFSTPGDAWRAYLIAIKQDDLAAAKNCWWIVNEEETQLLDVIVGMWVAHHRFSQAMRTLGIDEKQLGGELIRDDCTDAAIDRTLARLNRSPSVIKRDIAEIRIAWREDDGYPNSAFWYGDDPILFRKAGGGWKIDTYAMTGIEVSEETSQTVDSKDGFEDPWKWLNDVSKRAESGQLETAEDVVAELERHLGSLEGRIPITREVIFELDTAERFLRITKGNPGIVSTAPEALPHRPDIQDARKIEGDVEFIFETIYGWDRPKIVVETIDQRGYEVVYDRDDEYALAVVAEKLGMTVKEELREILALSLAIVPEGHNLRRCPKPDKPQWDSSARDDVWPLHGVTMDELVKFLESRYRRPVVNKTELTGYYTLDLSDKAAKVWPQDENEIMRLDDTGLQIKWERSTTQVLVITDKGAKLAS